MGAHNAEGVRRRPVRFHHFYIPEEGQIWLEGNDFVLSAEYTGSHWHIVVQEFGPEQSDGTRDGAQ